MRWGGELEKSRKGKCFANVKKKLAEGKGTSYSCKTKTNSNEPLQVHTVVERVLPEVDNVQGYGKFGE